MKKIKFSEEEQSIIANVLNCYIAHLEHPSQFVAEIYEWRDKVSSITVQKCMKIDDIAILKQVLQCYLEHLKFAASIIPEVFNWYCKIYTVLSRMEQSSN